MSTDEIDWDALLSMAEEATSSTLLQFGMWSGRIGHHRWCPIEAYDPASGWVGRLRVEPVIGGRMIAVEMHHAPSMLAVDISYFDPRGDIIEGGRDDDAEHLAKQRAQELADFLLAMTVTA